MNQEWIKLLERCCNEETGEVNEKVLAQQLRLLRNKHAESKRKSLSAKASESGKMQVKNQDREDFTVFSEYFQINLL
jgi:hypothetical protein